MNTQNTTTQPTDLELSSNVLEQSVESVHLPSYLTDEIFELVPDRFRKGVLDGSLVVLDRKKWFNKEKPLILDASTRKIRSGRYATANDLGVISKQFAYKRTRGYREMKEMFIPAAKDSKTRDAIVSLEEIVEALWNACLGSPQEVSCPDCGGKNIVAFKKDPKVLFQFYENLVGRATETSEVSVTNKSLIAILNDNTPLDGVPTIALDPHEAIERRKLIEGEFRDAE